MTKGFARGDLWSSLVSQIGLFTPAAVAAAVVADALAIAAVYTSPSVRVFWCLPITMSSGGMGPKQAGGDPSVMQAGGGPGEHSHYVARTAKWFSAIGELAVSLANLTCNTRALQVISESNMNLSLIHISEPTRRS